MRGIFSSLIGLICAGILAAQTEVTGDQCRGGWLTAIQSESISLKFNDKVTIMPMLPKSGGVAGTSAVSTSLL